MRLKKSATVFFTPETSQKGDSAAVQSTPNRLSAHRSRMPRSACRIPSARQSRAVSILYYRHYSLGPTKKAAKREAAVKVLAELRAGLMEGGTGPAEPENNARCSGSSLDPAGQGHL
ncbi:hypothetical protein NDU88_001162 [Pleurodeles waltl]|uniref:DRBM domain-containing protein n=1 Tax=Pleurodeles waltl TaxID=8319 RepID=A0AAV7M4H7_PLEWA|nr:hypothetical protein NDU88_001162 [Pleurodeles waltl]